MQSEHQTSAVERAEEVVRLEGELAAAKAQAESGRGRPGCGGAPADELAETRADELPRARRAERERDAALAKAPDADALAAALTAGRAGTRRRAGPGRGARGRPVAPLPRRVRPIAARHREWTPAQRAAVVATPFVALVLLAILLLTLL